MEREEPGNKGEIRFLHQKIQRGQQIQQSGASKYFLQNQCTCFIGQGQFLTPKYILSLVPVSLKI